MPKPKDYIIKEHGTGKIYKIIEDYNPDPVTDYKPTEKEMKDFLNRETARLNAEKQQEQKPPKPVNNEPKRLSKLLGTNFSS